MTVSQRGTCGVCKEPFNHQPQPPPLKQMWTKAPYAMFFHVALASLCIVGGIVAVITAPAFATESVNALVASIMGAFLTIVGAVDLHHYIGDGTAVRSHPILSGWWSCLSMINDNHARSIGLRPDTPRTSSRGQSTLAASV